MVIVAAIAFADQRLFAQMLYCRILIAQMIRQAVEAVLERCEIVVVAVGGAVVMLHHAIGLADDKNFISLRHPVVGHDAEFAIAFVS